MMRHVLEEYEEQFGEERPQDPSSSSGLNREVQVNREPEDPVPTADEDMGINQLFQMTGEWHEAQELKNWGDKISQKKKDRNWDDDVKAMNDMLVKEGLDATAH